MKIYISLMVFVSTILLSSCTKSDISVDATNINKQTINMKNDDSIEYDDIYSLYVQNDDYILSLYEPQEGCYLGAYILSDKESKIGIEEFEDIVNKQHCNYIYNMKLGERFPLNWVLECFSMMKTPYIIIEPPDEYNPFKYDELEKLSKDFGEFFVPIFVQFYPNPQNKNYEPLEYIKFYSYARELFKKNASNVSFVWSVDIDGVYDSNFYYPGNDNTDWVGVNIYEPIDIESNGYSQSIKNNLDYFYYTYQKSKPIMISQLAISHFTSNGHKYYTDIASSELKNIYYDIIYKYPRIKAVNYMNLNNFDTSPKSAIKDNFSITDEENVLNAYRESISHKGYISELLVANSGENNKEFFKSPFVVYKVKNDLFIPEKTLIYDIKIENIDLLKNLNVLIGEDNCYNINDIKVNYKLNFEIDNNNKIITVSNVVE